jgi:sugar lactone lactonase YvrE
MPAKTESNLPIAFLLLSLLLASCSDAPDATSGAAPAAPSGLVEPDADWQPVGEGLVFTDGFATAADGSVYFADVYLNRLYKVSAEDEVRVFDESTAHTMGLAFGPDGLLYGCRNDDAQIVRYNAAGKVEVLLQGELSPVPDDKDNPGEFCNDMAINADGGIWFTDRVNKRVIYLAPDGSSRTVAGGFRPNGIILSLDQKVLVVTDSNEPVLHAFTVGENGELAEIEKFFDPILMPQPMENGEVLGKGKPGTDGMAVDTEGRYYVATLAGIQVFDRDGRHLGVINGPPNLYFNSNLDFGGPDYQWLYASGRNGVARIKMLARGAARFGIAP